MHLKTIQWAIFLFMVATIHKAVGQEREVIHLWPEQVPGERAEKQPHVLSDDSSNNVTRIAAVTDPVLHVYRPKSADKNQHTGIIVCPGGGYSILAIDLEGHEIAEWLTRMGYTAFVLEYRVPKNQLGALQDIQRAIRLVRSRANQWGLSDEIGAIGFSAGGSLVARASSLYDQSQYKSTDAADQLSAKPSFSLLIYPAYLDQGENRTLTPELKIDESHPPTFIFCTADDPYGNSGLVMAGALRDAKVPVEFHLYNTGGHGYGLRNGNIAAETWPLLAEKWLKQLH